MGVWVVPADKGPAAPRVSTALRAVLHSLRSLRPADDTLTPLARGEVRMIGKQSSSFQPGSSPNWFWKHTGHPLTGGHFTDKEERRWMSDRSSQQERRDSSSGED